MSSRVICLVLEGTNEDLLDDCADKIVDAMQKMADGTKMPADLKVTDIFVEDPDETELEGLDEEDEEKPEIDSKFDQ